MIQIATYLKKLGFELSIHENDFNGQLKTNDGIELNIICFDSVLGIQASFNGLKRTIIDSSKIENEDELIFILSRNIFIKSQCQILYEEMIRLQTLSNVKHP